MLGGMAELLYGYSRDSFLESLRLGYKWQEYVAGVLVKAGIEVRQSPLEIAKTEGEIRRFTENEQDLIANGEYIEVKSRSLNFSSPSDFPFTTAIIDTVYGWKRKRVKPFSILIVSQQTGGIAVVDGGDRDSWTVGRDYDKRRGQMIVNYHVPKDRLLGLDWLVERLKGKDASV